MNKFILMFFIFFAPITFAKDIVSQHKNMKEGEELVTSINLGKGLKIEAVLDKTVRGNGTLLIGNTLLRIRDLFSDDLVTYHNEYLDVSCKDINADGINELIVSGIIKLSNRESSEVEMKSSVFIYSYSKSENKLVELFKNSPIEIDLTKK